MHVDILWMMNEVWLRYNIVLGYGVIIFISYEMCDVNINLLNLGMNVMIRYWFLVNKSYFMCFLNVCIDVRILRSRLSWYFNNNSNSK